ncbi:MAG: ribosome maturation factor RimP [Firmicutes bacterium HGW-Firmicutes-11]|jgi:ribosome maturation factor RimP|nr:MAG: ribosome maturation factor RimP [Firmicutes bacterium HGW-Firmicutes-11]
MSKRVTELVTVMLEPFLKEQGYELYHLEFVKEQKDWYLRVFIEKSPERDGDWPGNVGTDDCEIVSRYLAAKLDETDPIEQNYYLEVSSPGMDRPLLKEKDYARYRGAQVDVRLYESIGGKRNLFGKLSDYNSETITIELENGESITLPREKVSKVKLAIIF